jgi:hypothetical protein
MTSNGIIYPAAVVCTIFSLASCGSNPSSNIPNRLPTFAIRGTVLVDDDPSGSVTVRFNPVIPREKGEHQTMGVTDDNGRITVSTYGLGDGAPAGEYVLTFSKRTRVMGNDGPDALNERYEAIQRSPFKFVVANGPLDIGEIKLTTK